LAVGGIYAFVVTGARSARVTNDFVQTQAQVRAALDTVVDEIRWAQGVTCASASSVSLLIPQSTPFSATSPYQVTFSYDAAGDTMLRREDAAGTGCPPSTSGDPVAYSLVRADGSDGVIFEYFDGTGTSLGSSPANLAAIIRVRLTVTTTRNGTSRTFAGDAALRAR
jgi:hypothetical protein